VPDIPFRFSEGARVRVVPGPPESHCRTPAYLRGKPGEILACLGAYRIPSRLAFHKPGLPARPLYRVRFHQGDLWPEAAPGTNDTLVADLYEHWLETDEEH